MKDRGFIFTLDAALALIPILLLISTISNIETPLHSYTHTSLKFERYAQDVLTVLEYNETILNAFRRYKTGYEQGNSTKMAEAVAFLNNSVSSLLPDGMYYYIDAELNNSIEFSFGRGNISRAKNTYSAIRTVIGSARGWAGRAWYKVESAEFVEEERRVTTTLWNFHNWLSNFYSPPSYDWGYNQAPIHFTLPENASANSIYYLQGSCDHSGGSSFSIDVYINSSLADSADSSDFVFLYNIGSRYMYNYLGTINPSLISPGDNTLVVDFKDPGLTYNDDMPWFALIADYNTTVFVPSGITTKRYDFSDAAGYANPSNAKFFDVHTGTITSVTPRTMSWSDYLADHSVLDSYDDGNPFVISQGTGLPGGDGGSAISVVKEFTIPSSVPEGGVLDATVVVNLYGGVDAALVEVWDQNTTSWKIVFCSFDIEGVHYSARSDGYGNLPGIISIKKYVKPGDNKVRITFWDYVPSTDYDLVGIIDSYVSVSYTTLPITWDVFPFSSYQDGDSSYSQIKTFTTRENAHQVYLFFGLGLDTRHVKVELYDGSTWRTYYDSNVVPYYINLASLDASLGYNIITEPGSTATDYTIKQGTFTVKVTVTGPGHTWESGDRNRNAEIYSGTRVIVLYPEFIATEWAIRYSDSPSEAENLAREALVEKLRDEYGIITNTTDPLIYSDSSYIAGKTLISNIRVYLWEE